MNIERTITKQKIDEKILSVEIVFETIQKTNGLTKYKTMREASGLSSNEIAYLIKNGFIKNVGRKHNPQYKIINRVFEPINARRMINEVSNYWASRERAKTKRNKSKRTTEKPASEIEFPETKKPEYTVKKYDYKPTAANSVKAIKEFNDTVNDEYFVEYCERVLNKNPNEISESDKRQITESVLYRNFLLNINIRKLAAATGMSFKATAAEATKAIKAFDEKPDDDEILRESEKRAYNGMPDEITVNDSRVCIDKKLFAIVLGITFLLLGLILGYFGR